jgi:hypothetical protein
MGFRKILGNRLPFRAFPETVCRQLDWIIEVTGFNKGSLSGIISKGLNCFSPSEGCHKFRPQ